MSDTADVARFRCSKRVLVLACILLGQVTSNANVIETAYYKTALIAHRDDVAQFQSIALAALSKVELAELPAGGWPTAEQVDGFIERISAECQDTTSPIDCRFRMDRLRSSLDERDGLSQYLLHWIGKLMVAWNDSRIFHPEDATRYSEFLPKPYPYLNADRIAAYFPPDERHIHNHSSTHVLHVASTSHPAYRVKSTVSTVTFDSSSLRKAIRDFLLTCAMYESILGLLDSQRTPPDTDDRAIDADIPAAMNTPHTASSLAKAFTHALVNLLNYVLAIEAAITPAQSVSTINSQIDDLPTRLKDNSSFTSEIRPIYDVFELINSGIRPSSALARLSHKVADEPCNWNHVLGMLAREWDGSAVSIGGFNRTSIFDYVDAGEGLLYASQISKQLKASCPGLFGVASNANPPNLLVSTFELINEMHARLGDRSNTLSAEPVPMEDVLRLTAHLIDRLRTLTLSTIGAQVQIPDRRLAQWMDIYVSAAEQNYQEAVSGTLCYLFGMEYQTSESGTRLGAACDEEISTSVANHVAALTEEGVDAGQRVEQILALVEQYIVACTESAP